MAIIQASIPLFFLLIGLELLVAVVRRERLARLNDSITDLSLGIFSQLTGVFTKLFSVGLYIAAAQYLAVQRFTALPAWIAIAGMYSSSASSTLAHRAPRGKDTSTTSDQAISLSPNRFRTETPGAPTRSRGRANSSTAQAMTTPSSAIAT